MGVQRLVMYAAVVTAAGLVVLVGQASAAPRVGTACFGQPATIVGTDGDDTLIGTPGNDVIVAGDGSDIIAGGAGDDLICGEAGADFIFGQDGNDSIDAGAGADAIIPGAGDDKVIGGGEGDLLAFIQAAGPVTASLVTGTATGDGSDTFSGIGSLAGGPFNDTLTGDAQDFNALIGEAGDDVLDGGAGFDAAIYTTGPITANLLTGVSTGGEGNDTLRGIEGLEGTSQDDNFTGDAGTNVLDGRGGNDILAGGDGTDLLQGDAQIDTNPGNDRLSGGNGDDFLQPSPGSDILDAGPGRQDLLDLSVIHTSVAANLGTSQVTGQGIGKVKLTGFEGIFGGPAADTLTGDKGPNVLYGNDGTDRLAGAAGDDFLSGGAGADTFDGGPGVDYCLDGSGKGCEFSGTPTASRAAAVANEAQMAAISDSLAVLRAPNAPRPFALSSVSAGGENNQLGEAGCEGSIARATRSVASAGAAKRKTEAGPPHKAPSAKNDSTKPIVLDLIPDWLVGPLDAIAADESLKWQGTLFRYDAKKKAWRSYKKTLVAFGHVDPSGTAVWTTAAGQPVGETGFTVPAGQFAWKGTLQVPGSPTVTDWIEPHTDFARKGGGIFAPSCAFGA